MLRKIIYTNFFLLALGVAYGWWNNMLHEAPARLASFWQRAGIGSGSRQLDLGRVFRDKRDAARPGETEPVPVPQLTGVPVTQLDDVLRFDVRPAWITSRWAHVSTVLSEQQYQGLRVPLVTGTELDDLAGSLTYYFDHQRQVRRVAFTGRTGDPSKIVELVTKRFGFQAVPDLGAGLYLVRWNRQPTSALRVSLASVIRSEEPLSRFDVELEINRPDMDYQLSPRFQRIVARDRSIRRW